MSHFEDLGEKVWPGGIMFWRDEFESDHPGVATKAVGWLGDSVPTTGVLSAEAIAALAHFASWAKVEDFFLGSHACELCGEETSHGEFWVLHGNVRYVLPQLMLHYVKAHAYCPPDTFVRDLLEAWRERSDDGAMFPYGVDAQMRKVDLQSQRYRSNLSRSWPWWRFW